MPLIFKALKRVCWKAGISKKVPEVAIPETLEKLPISVLKENREWKEWANCHMQNLKEEGTLALWIVRYSPNLGLLPEVRSFDSDFSCFFWKSLENMKIKRCNEVSWLYWGYFWSKSFVAFCEFINRVLLWKCHFIFFHWYFQILLQK